MDLTPLDSDDGDLLSMVFSGRIDAISITDFEDHQMLTLHFIGGRSVSIAADVLYWREEGIAES